MNPDLVIAQPRIVNFTMVYIAATTPPPIMLVLAAAGMLVPVGVIVILTVWISRTRDLGSDGVSFVRGLMAATLFNVGCLSAIPLITQFSSIQSVLSYVPGMLALPLAFLLFTRSKVAYGIAFFYLAFSANVFAGNLFLRPLFGEQPPVPLHKSFEWIAGYSFPCIVAVVERWRHRSTDRAPSTSDDVEERI